MPALFTDQIGKINYLESIGGNTSIVADYPDVFLDIAITPDGSVYATTHNTLYQLDLAAESKTVVAELGGLLGYFPTALTSDSAGNLYFGYSNKSNIDVFNPSTGNMVRTFNLEDIRPGSVLENRLEDMLILDDKLYAVNTFGTIFEFEVTSTGSLNFIQETFAGRYVGLFSENGNIYGVDNFGNIGRFDPDNGTVEFADFVNAGGIETGAASNPSGTITIPQPDPDPSPDTSSEIFRFLNTETGAHFFTASTAERDHLLQNNPAFTYEGNVFDSNASEANGGVPVYRFINTQTGTHLYTASEEERQNISSNLPHMNFEEVSYYAYSTDNESNIALHRFYNTQNGTHFFTASEQERDNIISTLGHYNYEGVAYYVDLA